MAHEIRVSVLGGFGVDLDGRPVPDAAWRRNRARALVKLLALARRHRLHRDQVMDALWPTLDADAAAGNLRKAIHFARQAIGAEHIRIHGGLVVLDAPALWVDVHAFEEAARAGPRSEALGLYRGELLPEDRFEPWTDDPRERLRGRFNDLLLDEAAALETEGQYDAAAEVLDRLVASDPLHEEAHRILVRVLALAGARYRALTRYGQFAARLRDELGVEPEPALRGLVDEIASGRFPAEADTPGQPGTPSSRPSIPDPAMVEERRLVTVLSAAVAMAGPRFPRRNAEAWTTDAQRIAASWGGMTDVGAGGELIAVYGVPTAHEDDAARALNAALEIAARRPGSSRVGVSTGEVIAAAGGAWSFERITGDVLAQAAALRAAAVPGTTLTAERTLRSAGAAFRYSDLITVATEAKPIVARALLAEERPAFGPLSIEAPLIGRDPELAVVLGLVGEAIASGQPRLVELSGLAGVGKSRLARELLATVAGRWPDAKILRGRCLSGARGATFGALSDILREACGISSGDTADEAEVRLRLGLTRLLGAVDPGDVDPTTFALATTAGISLAANPFDRLPPNEVADRLGLAWPVFASACATAAPALFLIEDGHWARPELLDIVEHVARRARGPLVIVLTARPELHELRPSFGLGGEVSTIAIRPLGPAHSEALVDSLVAHGELESGVRADLLARAEGNPFYLEQLIHHLRSGGSTTLPDTLQSLLGARLDALPIGERRVLQEASVAGRVFWEGPILAAIAEGRVAARLSALERKGFIVRRTVSSLQGQAEFAFRHALLSDVAYASLAPARRARAHAGMGSWLEALAGDRIDEVVDQLAHHYWTSWSANLPELAPADGIDRASIRAKAFVYSLRAGDAARRRFVMDRAIELHERARAIAGGPDEQLASLEALARDREEEFHGDAAALRYREALAIARAHPGRPADRARLCRRLAWMMAWNPGAFRVNPDATEAEQLVDEGMAFAQDDTDRAWLSLVRGTCARLYRGSEPMGQGTRADPRPIGERIAGVEQALGFARGAGQDELAAAASQALGMLYGLAGKYDEMLELASRQVAELRPEHSRLDQSDAIRKLAVHLINVRADFRQGLELGRRCRQLLGAAGANGPHQVMHTLWPILVSLFYLGRWNELLGPLDEHVEAFRNEPATECQFVRDGPAIGAATLTLLGRPDEAAETASLLGDPLADRDSASAWQARLATLTGQPATARAISQDKALEGRGYGPQHAFALLEALSAQGDWDSARIFLPTAGRTVSGNALLEPMTDRVAGLVALAEGDADHAARRLRRAARGFRRLEVPFEEARSLLALAEALPTGWEAPRARALAIFDRLGAEPAARAMRRAGATFLAVDRE